MPITLNGNGTIDGIIPGGFPDGFIDANDIAAGAVIESKIQNSAVTASKLANTAVTADKIANAAVTNSKLASGSVTTDSLAAEIDFTNKSISGMILSRGSNTTTSDGSRGGWADHITGGTFTVPSGTKALVYAIGATHGNYEANTGQGGGRIQARGPSTVTSPEVSWHRGFFDNYAGSGHCTAIFLLDPGTWSLHFQTASFNGTFISNYYSATDQFTWLALKITS